MEGEELAASWATFAAVPVTASRGLNLELHAAFQTLSSEAGRRLHAARGMDGEGFAATFAAVPLAVSSGLDLEPTVAAVPQLGLGSQL